jgi:hypothetical protein
MMIGSNCFVHGFDDGDCVLLLGIFVGISNKLVDDGVEYILFGGRCEFMNEEYFSNSFMVYPS